MKYILASKSPRRIEILNNLNLDFEIKAANCKEFCDKDTPEEIVKDLAELKANTIFNDQKLNQDLTVIAADTIVVFDGEIFGMPQNTNHAYQMLKSLNDNWHYVYTGVCLKIYKDDQLNTIKYAEKTAVHMKYLSDNQIWEYIDTGKPMDKAGSYGIQDFSESIIDEIKGEYHTVVGLPVVRLKRELGL